MKKEYNTSDIPAVIEWIKEKLTWPGSNYIIVNHSNGGRIKVRVSDHSARHQNNDMLTVSFIRRYTDQGYGRMASEWVITDSENMITDTFENVADILESEFENIKPVLE